MKTLILCVDRDDDLGEKAAVETPVVGRRAVLEAASRLGVADPEDSDVNALFAAVRLYDREHAASKGPDRQVEVAAVAGHRIVGLRSDRIVAKELDAVLAQTRADEVVLVSDGAEDEQVLPILASRVRVAHVHRSIVKQAPRLEGFYHVLTRMLDDDKLAKRYVLPLGLILLVWAVAFLFGLERLAWGITLGIAGFWLVVHAMHWEDRVTRFLQDLGEGLRTGQVALVANVAMVLVFVVGAVHAAQTVQGLPAAATRTMQTLVFIQAFLWWFVSGLLVRTAGRLFDEWIREGATGVGSWTAVFTLVALGFIGTAAADVAVEVAGGSALTALFTFDVVLRLVIGLVVAMAGILVVKHLRSFLDARPAAQRVR